MVRDAIAGTDPAPVPLAVSVSPNPVKDILIVQCSEPDILVVLYSLAGQVVLGPLGTKKIDVSALKPGIYILRIAGQRSGRSSCFKIIR